ncbi:succinate dehydrogenase, hydrophobic membrane anchor protein [Candidatus Puniceispirillum sp.]|uniref:succinate dehydrogenase, hydrophobic membrane anchor protein n=1 Tax=Candidatus Puniceispirillum sp. TaxID=2026719 RepID=UPI003F699845
MEKNSYKTMPRPRVSGLSHWRWQRMSAVAVLILMAYFVFVVTRIGTLDYQAARAFLAIPYQALALALLVVIGVFHGTLGAHVVIEDYVPVKSGRHALILSVNIIMAIIAGASLIAIASIAF